MTEIPLFHTWLTMGITYSIWHLALWYLSLIFCCFFWSICVDKGKENIPDKVNTLRLRQNGRHFPDDNFKWIFLNENISISINISLKFVPKGPMNNIPTLVQIMAWRRPGDKPLYEPMMVSFWTHICITRPQCYKYQVLFHEGYEYKRFYCGWTFRLEYPDGNFGQDHLSFFFMKIKSMDKKAIGAWTKWLLFWRWHFRMHFLEGELLFFDWNFTGICSWCSDYNKSALV